MSPTHAQFLRNLTGRHIPTPVKEGEPPPTLTPAETQLVGDLQFFATDIRVVRVLKFVREQATAVHDGRRSDKVTDNELRASKAKLEAITNEIPEMIVKTIENFETQIAAREHWIAEHRDDQPTASESPAAPAA